MNDIEENSESHSNPIGSPDLWHSLSGHSYCLPELIVCLRTPPTPPPSPPSPADLPTHPFPTFSLYHYLWLTSHTPLNSIHQFEKCVYLLKSICANHPGNSIVRANTTSPRLYPLCLMLTAIASFEFHIIVYTNNHIFLLFFIF